MERDKQRSSRVRIDPAHPPYPKWLPYLLRGIAVILGAASAGAAMVSESMNADGMNYLDMGDALLRGDWVGAINGVWSPLYSWILGSVLHVVQPSMRWEFATVHAVNFVLYVVTLICFEFFWRHATRHHEARGSTGGGDTTGFPGWIWLSVGYGVFVWSSLSLIEVYSVTPDMCVAACVYLAGGLLLRIGRGEASRGPYLLFGVVLGLGYLSKAVMFPLGFVFLGVGMLTTGDLRRGAVRMAPAVLTFLLICGSFITALSITKGRFTFSDIGKLTYLKHVHEVSVPHWQPGVDPEIGEPIHPARRIWTDPPIYEFASPVGGTYPMSYDPYYWYEGLEARFDLGRQVKALVVNGQFYFDLFVRQLGGILAVVLVLSVIVVRLERKLWLSGASALIVVSTAAIGLYALVHVTGRYIAPFVVLFLAGSLIPLRLPGHGENGRLMTAAGGTILLFIVLNIGAFNLEGLNALLGYVPRAAAPVAGAPTASARPSVVANGLLESGLQRRDRVVFIGYSFDAYWARLARLKIVAEVLPEDAESFWRAEAETRKRIRQALARTGARAIVAEIIPADGVPDGWKPVGDTGYYFRELR